MQYILIKFGNLLISLHYSAKNYGAHEVYHSKLENEGSIIANSFVQIANLFIKFPIF